MFKSRSVIGHVALRTFARAHATTSGCIGCASLQRAVSAPWSWLKASAAAATAIERASARVARDMTGSALKVV
jgi:hypothetical protein